MIKTYESDLLASIHSTASSFNEAGIMSKKTMREFDSLCLTEIKPLNNEEIKELRKSENVSQTVFALYLNVSKNLVSQWERGEKKPSALALKLLFLVKKLGLTGIA